MKFKVISLALLCTGLGLSVQGVSAQTKRQTSDEAIRSTGRAERRLDNISFRMTLRTEWFTERDGDLSRETVETLAAARPDRYQSISEVGGTRIETIVAGDKTFRRTNDSDWETVAVPPIWKAGDPSSVAMFGDLAGGATLPLGAGKLVAKGTIDGEEVSMYEVLQIKRDPIGEAGDRTEVTRHWINNDGLIVRRIVEHAFAGDKRFMRSTANYTYTDIRIEEPILPVIQQD